MSLIEKLSDEQQQQLIMTAGKAMTDPWFVPTATVPMAYFLAFLPHFTKIALLAPLEADKYNNVTPRYTNWDEKPHAKWIIELVKRLASCHENGLEAMIGFAPAVLLCKLNRVKDVAAVRELSLAFCKYRFLYFVAYALGQWRLVSLIRTLVWAAGLKATFQLYALAIM